MTTIGGTEKELYIGDIGFVLINSLTSHQYLDLNSSRLSFYGFDHVKGQFAENLMKLSQNAVKYLRKTFPVNSNPTFVDINLVYSVSCGNVQTSTLSSHEILIGTVQTEHHNGSCVTGLNPKIKRHSYGEIAARTIERVVARYRAVLIPIPSLKSWEKFHLVFGRN